jgi:hypothetical protein
VASRFARRWKPEVKRFSFRAFSFITRHHCFQIGESLFYPLIENLQENTGQKSNSIHGTQIKKGLVADSVDRFFQEFAHFRIAFERSVRQPTCVVLPVAVLLPSWSI